MRYRVIGSFKAKTSQGEKELQPGQVITLPEGTAASLLSMGKIAPADSQEAPTEDGNLSPKTTVTAVPAKPPLPAYRIVYSRILDDLLLMVDTDAHKAALEASGVEDSIYTRDEVEGLKGLPEVSIKAHHAIKKALPSSRIERGQHG